MDRESDVTQVLADAGRGDGPAMNRLFPIVYDELRRIAGAMMAQERADHTLQATAVVHEVFIKLFDQTRVDWRGRVHFLSVASEAIRRILVDHARTRGRYKRGGDRSKIVLDESLVSAFESDIDLLSLEEALERLAQNNARQAKLVAMRFFGGMTVEEAASILGISTATAERDWRFARAVLYRDLVADREPPDCPTSNGY